MHSVSLYTLPTVLLLLLLYSLSSLFIAHFCKREKNRKHTVVFYSYCTCYCEYVVGRRRGGGYGFVFSFLLPVLSSIGEKSLLAHEAESILVSSHVCETGGNTSALRVGSKIFSVKHGHVARIRYSCTFCYCSCRLF